MPRPYELLSALAWRIRKADPALDWRLIDAEVYLLVMGQQPEERAEPRHGKHHGTVVSYYRGGSHGTWTVSNYTSKVDDALRLCKSAGQDAHSHLSLALADAEFAEPWQTAIPFNVQLARRIVAVMLEDLAAQAREERRRA